MHLPRSRSRVFLLTLALSAACSDDGQQEGTTTDTETDTDATDTQTDTGEEANCGNGVVEPGEFCDDGNTSNTDDCLNSCYEASCPDGFLHEGTFEQCDDGNLVETDACTATCQIAVCGDHFVWEGMEVCDDGDDDDTDGCPSNCQLAACGDGFLYAGVEECDDGNTEDGDGCRSDCTLPLLPMPGDACDTSYMFQCVPEIGTDAGTPLLCDNGTLVETDLFEGACGGLCPMGTNVPVDACAGWGEFAYCLCLPPMPEPCDGAQLGCQGDDTIALCHDGQVVFGSCFECAVVDGYHTCQEG